MNATSSYTDVITPCSIVMQLDNMLEGGMENMAIDLALFLREQGYSIAFWVFGDGGLGAQKAKQEGFSVYFCSDEPDKIKEQVKTAGVKIVFAHYSTTGAKTYAELGIPFVQILHNCYVWFNENDVTQFKEAIQSTTLYIAVSDAVKQYAISNLSLPPDKCLTIPNAISLNKFNVKNKIAVRENCRKELGFDKSDYLFVTVASVLRAKRLFAIVRAFHAALSRCKEIRLVILGFVYDTEYLSEITAYIEHFNLGQYIKLLGHTHNPEVYYATADAFVHGAAYEGGPLTLLEAIVANLTVVSTNVGLANSFYNNQGVFLIDKHFDNSLQSLVSSRIVLEPVQLVASLTKSIILANECRQKPDLPKEFIRLLDKKLAYEPYALTLECLLANKSLPDFQTWSNQLPRYIQQRLPGGRNFNALGDPFDALTAGVQYELELLSSNIATLQAKNCELETYINELAAKNAELAATNTELAAKNAELAATNTELAATNTELAATNTELAATNTELAATNTELAATNTELAAKNTELETKNNELGAIENRYMLEIVGLMNSLSWRITAPLRYIKKNDFSSIRYEVIMFFYDFLKLLNYANFKKFTAAIRIGGWKYAATKAKNLVKKSMEPAGRQPSGILLEYPDDAKRYEPFVKCQDLLKQLQTCRGVFVMGSLCMGWNEVFKQRHHHIADHFMNAGYVVICAMNPIYSEDYTESIKQEKEKLFLVNFDDRLFWRSCIDFLALESNVPLFYHLIGTEPGTTLEDLKTLKQSGFILYYDYIDELSTDIFRNLPPMCLERHETLLKDQDVLLVATADKLYNDACAYRKDNVILNPNGVTLEDWKTSPDDPVPAEIADIVAKQTPIIGFYGSFATWLDYTYIKSLALARPTYDIVMIGYDYEGGEGAFAQSGVADLPNVRIVPPQKYENLKFFSRHFDVGIVPFRAYGLTDSVSPVKMFEYMAQGLPVVASNLKECQKYASVLNTDSAEGFLEQVDKALELKSDLNYLELLRKDAEANTWKQRVLQVEEALDSISSKRHAYKILSVVVPVYNMEKFLHRCLDSILFPSLLDWLDVIVVNDGSQDDSLKIAYSYANRFPNTVRVIDKKNGGHGSCINAGIKHAVGRYYKLIDSDDWVNPLSLVAHVNFLRTTDADMIVTNYKRVFEDKKFEDISYSERLEEKEYTRKSFYQSISCDLSHLSYAHMHSITYKSEILQKQPVRITENSFYVDQEFITYPLVHVNRVAFQNVSLYRYFIGRKEQSVNPEVASKRAPMNYAILKNIKQFLLTIPHESEQYKYILQILYHQAYFFFTYSSDNEAKENLLAWFREQDEELHVSLQYLLA